MAAVHQTTPAALPQEPPAGPSTCDAEGFSALQSFTLYESRTLMVIRGSDKAGSTHRLLTLDRTSPYDLKVAEDAKVYPTAASASQRAMSLIANSGSPLERSFPFAAILGFLRLPKVFIVLALTREKVASIGGRWIYSVGDWKLKAVGHKSFDPRRPPSVSRYKAMIIDDVELNKDFYFSYFYDLTHSLQTNLMAGKGAMEDEINAVTKAQAAAATAVTGAAAGSASEVAPVSAAASAAASALDEFDPLAFDPIHNTIPQGRRRTMSTTTPPALSSSTATTDKLPPLPESDETMERAHVDSTPLPELPSPPTNIDPHAAEFFFSGGVKSPMPPATAAASPAESAYHPVYAEKWLWNLHLAREFLHYLPHGSYWLVPLTHGFVQQHSLRIGRRDVLVTLIARRSRHFAGTRFIKRGVSSLGHVANEVETEQIVQERQSFVQGSGAFSSVLMLRGSIPLYWAQENPKSPKPEIIVYSFDRECAATRKHFDDCFRRYGAPCAVLSLIKKEEKSPQETRLGQAFQAAIGQVSATYRWERAAAAIASSAEPIGQSREQMARDEMERIRSCVEREGLPPFPTAHSNGASSFAQEDRFSTRPPPYSHPSYEPSSILYCAYDFLTERSKLGGNVLRDLKGLVHTLVDDVGVFAYTPRPAAAATAAAEARGLDPCVLSVQRGIVRVNCVDCLDRTNVGQFCVGKAAIKLQLRALNIQLDGGDEPALPRASGATASASSNLDVYPELVAILQDMYTQHGDRIAHQYAGSGAMHKEILYDSDETGGNGGSGIGSIAELDGGSSSSSSSSAGSKTPSKNITQNALSAIKRYYNNNFNDNDKQAAMNVWLGCYIPSSPSTPRARPPIWELDVYTNLQDSDQLFAKDGDRFRAPFVPSAIVGGLPKGKLKESALTIAAVGGATQDHLAVATNKAATVPPPMVRTVSGGLSVGTGSSARAHQHARFLQYFSETYAPCTATSFDEELKKTFQAPVVVKLPPGALDAAYAKQAALAAIEAQSEAAAIAAANLAAFHGPMVPMSDPTEAPSPTNAKASSASPNGPRRDLSPATAASAVPARSPTPASSPPAPAAAPAAAPAPAPVVLPPPASKNLLKRGFGNLFSSAKASFTAALAPTTPTPTPAPMPKVALPVAQPPPPAPAPVVKRPPPPTPSVPTSGVISFATLLHPSYVSPDPPRVASPRAPPKHSPPPPVIPVDAPVVVVASVPEVAPIPLGYLHSAASEAQALETYAAYMDTSRLFTVGSLDGPAAVNLEPQAAADPQVLVVRGLGSEASPASSSAAGIVSTRSLLDASARLSHHQLLDLLVSNLNDLRDLSETQTAQASLLAARPFVLPEIQVQSAAERKAANDATLQAMLASRAD